jgi:outer membrane protein TolC
MRRIKIIILHLVSIFLLCGCGRFDGKRIRSEHMDDFRVATSEQTEQELAGREPLDLDECLNIALRNNLLLRQAEIEAGIAKLDRKIAFANFLPMVEVSGQAVTLDYPPMLRAGEDPAGNDIFIQTRDKTVRDSAIEIQWAVFRPSTWFLYAARRRGEEIGNLMKEYTRQRVRLEVTSQYFHCLAIREAVQAMENRVAAAKRLVHETELKSGQGLATRLQVEETQLNLLANHTEQERLKNSEEIAYVDLMALMGLLPTRKCMLAQSGPLKTSEADINDLITEAMLNHPLLQVSDRKVEINRQMVDIALADFFPSLIGFGGASYTSDSYMKYSSTLSAGIMGVMTVFNGFSNVNHYRIAREKQKGSWLQREEMCLSVILQVLRAHAALTDCQKDALLAEKNLELASKRLHQTEAKSREGMASPLEVLHMTTLKDDAWKNQRIAHYRVQVSVEVLRHAIGINNEHNTQSEGEDDPSGLSR